MSVYLLNVSSFEVVYYFLRAFLKYVKINNLIFSADILNVNVKTFLNAALQYKITSILFSGSEKTRPGNFLQSFFSEATKFL